MTDGPFAEVKEQLGGFYLINAHDLDEALIWAAKMPSARYGSVVVRPMQAAIAALHAEARAPADTDWRQIAALYEMLAALNPSPVIALNAAVAQAFAIGLEHGLARMEELGKTGALDGYMYFHAARAELLRRLNRAGPARPAYERALELAGNTAERRYLQHRLAEVTAT